jgi:putative transposase
MQVQADSDLSAIVQRVKSLATKNLRNAQVVDDIPVWQPSFFDRALRWEEDIQAVARYIVANPLRAGLVTSLRVYPLWDAIWL